jgi:hypothetical protein
MIFTIRTRHRVRPSRPALALLVGLILVLAGGAPDRTASAQELLTNEGIVGMVKAGLPESVVVQKIRATAAAGRKFDTSADGLIKLKRAGVPDKVIEAMVSEPGGAPVAAAPARAVSADPTIAHVKAGGETALKPTNGTKEVHAAPFAGSRQEVVLPSPRAEYRISEKEPVFSTVQQPQQWILARLKPGKRDRNLPMSKNDGWGWGGATFRDGVDPKYAVKLVAEQGPGGLTKLRPEQPLAPGEYGFIAVTRGQPNMVEVFDFGVD